MSRGKNANFKRGNRTLAWYINEKLFDKADGPQDIPEMKRKNSVDSQSSLNSTIATVPSVEERRKKERRNRNRQRNSKTVEEKMTPVEVIEEPKVVPVPTVVTDPIIQQQLAAIVNKDRENYWYYDPTSDGFYYEHNGSRGWRKRNPKLHGNPPLSSGPAPLPQKTEETSEQPQTVEKKIYVPIPVPVYPPTSGSKYFTPPNQPANIKYYDPSTDGYFYEMASVDGWCRRQPQAQQQHARSVTSSSLLQNFQLGRDLTNQEVEELVLSKGDASGASQLDLAQLLARQMSKVNSVQQQPTADEYPSSSSTVSSTHSDDITPPPPTTNIPSKEQPVGSFEEPYEFYWSDNEKTGGLEKASSTSSVDETGANPLSAYFNTMINLDETKANRHRPESLKFDNRLPNFNVDRFIADLPSNDYDNFMNNLQPLATPFSMDTPVSPFNPQILAKDSPRFAPGIHRESVWEKTASADVERGLRDLEKIWH